MGKAWAPAVASIYMDQWESEIFRNTTLVPLLYRRYIDDIIILLENPQQVDILLSQMQSLDANIKLSGIQTGKSVHFLDLHLQLQDDGSVSSRLYRKQTDARVLLDFNSNHPTSLKINILTSQYIRYSRLFTSLTEAEQEMRIFGQLMHRIRAVPKRTLRTVWARYVKWRNKQPTTSVKKQRQYNLNCAIPADREQSAVVSRIDAFKSLLPTSIAKELCAVTVTNYRKLSLQRQFLTY